MNAIFRSRVVLAAILLATCLVAGCPERRRYPKTTPEPATADLGPTIGSVASVITPQAAPVEGYGLVGGLQGTGSAECPPAIRAYLVREIRRQLPAGSTLDVEKYISSLNTAAVLVEGAIPDMPYRGQYFDLKVTALAGTQTTSLDGGGLFLTELKPPGSFGVDIRNLGDALGPIFIDKVGNPTVDRRTGFVLAGGKVLNDYVIVLELTKQDFRQTNAIRNLLNGRFGDTTARAPAPGRIEVSVPPQYQQRRQRFAAMLKVVFLTQDPQTTAKRIKMLAERLAGTQYKYESEVALEAIGNQCLPSLRVLLSSPDESVRLHAARCMLNLGSDEALGTLRPIAMDARSPYRLDALAAVATAGRHNDAVALARSLLDDDNLQVRLAAYKHLRQLNATAIAQEFIGRNFYLERIAEAQHKLIYVSRSGQPCIVLFGAPIMCHHDIFVQSPDGDITINATADQNHVTILRRLPRRPDVLPRAQTSFDLADIIRTLCQEPPKEGERTGGLGVSYSDAAVLLKLMCDKGAVEAQFHAGPLPKIASNIKK
jgi:Flagellar P-ring protein